MVLEAVIEYTGPGHTPKLNILHFADLTPSAIIQATLNQYKTSAAAFLSNQYTVTYRPTLRALNTITGTLEGEVVLPGAITPTTGAISGQPVADATSALWRFNTASVVGGRFLRGRAFIPGIAVSQLAGGNLAGSVVTQMATQLALIQTASASSWGVWSRKNGVFVVMSVGTAWSELATQRRRRA